jgi:hypothetical protein
MSLLPRGKDFYWWILTVFIVYHKHHITRVSWTREGESGPIPCLLLLTWNFVFRLLIWNSGWPTRNAAPHLIKYRSVPLNVEPATIPCRSSERTAGKWVSHIADPRRCVLVGGFQLTWDTLYPVRWSMNTFSFFNLLGYSNSDGNVSVYLWLSWKANNYHSLSRVNAWNLNQVFQYLFMFVTSVKFQWA